MIYSLSLGVVTPLVDRSNRNTFLNVSLLSVKYFSIQITMREYSQSNHTLIARLRFIDGLSYSEIERQTHDTTADGAKSFCNRLRHRYPHATPNELVEYAPNRHNKGKRPRIQPGSLASIDIRARLRTDLRSYTQTYAGNLAFQEGTREPRPPRHPLRELGAQQIHNIARNKEHCRLDSINSKPVKRLLRRHRTALARENLQDREKFIEWVLTLPDTAIFICTDETPHHFDLGMPERVSAPSGEPQYYEDKVCPFSLMQWAAASGFLGVERPFKVWEMEQEEEVASLAHKLKEEVKALKEYRSHQRKRALEAGTPEYRLLEKENAAIECYNSTMKRIGDRSRRQRWTPERLFKEEKFVRDNKKGGMDFVWYAFEVYQKYLFPYYLKIRKRARESDPNAVVYITEDNVGVHGKARRLLAGYIADNEILFAEWPAWSPDLHAIEYLHHKQKEIIRGMMYQPHSASAAAKREAERVLRETWQGAEMSRHCERFASIQGVRELASRSKGADPPYSNKFKF